VIIIDFGRLFTAPIEGARIIRAAIKGAGMLVKGFEAGSDVAKSASFCWKNSFFPFDFGCTYWFCKFPSIYSQNIYIHNCPKHEDLILLSIVNAMSFYPACISANKIFYQIFCAYHMIRCHKSRTHCHVIDQMKNIM
jgi:hypothetical protein